MENNNYTTSRPRGRHLTIEERCLIEIRRKDGWKIQAIADEIGCTYNTVKNELKRGAAQLYNGKVERYKASIGQAKYKENRSRCVKPFKIADCMVFIQFVEKKFKAEKWSLDSCVGDAMKSGSYTREHMVCTKTLYNYVDKGFLKIKNIDLLEKVSRSQKHTRVKENKKKLGDSIEERPDIVDSREEFGHWEFDSVIGKKDANEPVTVTLVERMTRKCIWVLAADHSADALMNALEGVFKDYSEHLTEVFKTVTADNGSEFARLSELKDRGIGVYFTHPFSSYEKGSNERHNRIYRRFVPKGKSMSGLTQDDVSYFADIANGLPRKILQYSTPDELFEEQLDKIYAAGRVPESRPAA